MEDPVAQGLLRAVDACLPDTLPAETRLRLIRHATRHLPVEGRAEGSPFIPPMYALRVAESLGLAPEVSRPFAASGCLFFAAADLADDCADGQPRTSVGIDLNDTCLLLFACQAALLSLPVAPELRIAVSQLFADAGLRMAVGQEADLRGTDTPHAAPALEVARAKSGGELSAFFAGPALLAGLDPTPWRQFGEAFGALVQVLTDYFDLFLDPDSDDWQAGKPSLPIQHGLAHPHHGPILRRLLAGDRGGFDRKALGLWHLVQAGVADRLAETVALLAGEMADAEAQVGAVPVLAQIRAEIVEWCSGVIEGLAEYAGDAAPGADPLDEEVAACRDSAWRFLAADPLLEEATEVHRHGLFGAAEVRGGLFGRAIALEALVQEPLDLEAARAATFALADEDGWRYYPGHRALPTDGDCIGVMMQLAAGTADTTHPAHRLGADLLARADNQDTEGLFYTWLADPGRFDRAEIDATWQGEVCPGAAANALLGLWRHGWPLEAIRPRAIALALRASASEAPHSAFYPPAGVDFMVGRALLALRPALDDAPQVDTALEAIATRFLARRRLGGTFGDPLETAFAAFFLARLGRLEDPDSVVRALVDLQAADGGYAASRFYRTVPHPVTTWYGSRVVTTACVLQALRALEANTHHQGA